MVRLRCPHDGCTIEVADDLAGAQVRCPQCEQFLLVEPPFPEGPKLELPPKKPAGAPAPEKPAGPARPGPVEKRLHAGLPPLAVLLGVREGRGGFGPDALAAPAEMTEEDWKALDAFEKVLLATASLRTSLWYGVIGVLLTGVVWLGVATGSAGEPVFSPGRLASGFAFLFLFASGFVCMEAGRRHLERLRVGPAVDLAALAACGVALAFVAGAGLYLLPLFGGTPEAVPVVMAVLAMPFQVLGAFSAGQSSLRAYQALTQVRAPGILPRLTEALEYLEAVQRS
jgi:hypothetical protein